MRRIKISTNDDELGLFFPKNVDTDKICLLLQTLYPEINYEEEKIGENLYIVSKATILDNIKRGVREITSGVFIPGAHFEIADYKDKSGEFNII